MRLISQNGNFDIPYDEIVVELFDKCVVGRLKEYIGRDIILGAYSTDEKAQKAMEMLRTAYVGLPILFQNVDMNESVVDKLKEWKRDGIVLLHDNADSKIEQVNNAIFQFPQAEDVEV